MCRFYLLRLLECHLWVVVVVWSSFICYGPLACVPGCALTGCFCLFGRRMSLGGVTFEWVWCPIRGLCGSAVETVLLSPWLGIWICVCLVADDRCDLCHHL